MSNQRPGKTHRAAAGDSSQDMKLKNFFRDCKTVLSDMNDEAAFYFEQLEEYMMSGKPLPSERKEIARVLGV